MNIIRPAINANQTPAVGTPNPDTNYHAQREGYASGVSTVVDYMNNLVTKATNGSFRPPHYFKQFPGAFPGFSNLLNTMNNA